MPRPDWFLILNGKSAGDDAVREAVQALRARGVALQVRVTWEGGDAERFVAEALERGAGHVIAGGGDGSLSEVAAALAHADGDAGALPDRKSVVKGQSVSVRLDLGGHRSLKKKNQHIHQHRVIHTIFHKN